MKSPFPGMDPYLEDPAYWPDFHASLLLYARDSLQAVLPENYVARIDERLTLVEVPAGTADSFRPDLSILRGEESHSSRAIPHSTATLAPVTIPNSTLEEVRETRLEVLRLPERVIVTVIELLSPGNKSGLGHGEYSYKRAAMLGQNFNLVELDLLAGGQRIALRRPLPPGDYYTFVSRGERRPDCDVYAWRVRDPLPRIPLPLRAPDPDVTLDLPGVFALAYDRGRYGRLISYGVPPAAPLAPGDREWALKLAKH